MSDAPQVVFPPAEFVRRGPPIGIKDIHRQSAEKWSRVVLVTPRPIETSERTRHDFIKKGPFTLPLAVLREGADLGSRDAWQFFTHPYTVFPPEATFFNVAGKGCLGSRLFVRGQEGVRLYDEVGANLDGSEFVSESFHGALGVLRRRILGDIDMALESPLTPDLLELDVDLLQIFYLSTLLLRSEQPLQNLTDLYRLFRQPTLHEFGWDIFTEQEHDLMRKLQDDSLSEEQREKTARRFGVREQDFNRITDVVDRKGKQVVLEMLQEYEAFQEEHAATIAQLSREIHEQEQKLADIKGAAQQLQENRQGTSKFKRLFSRTDKYIKDLKADAVRAIRKKRELEAAFDKIPGYERLRGLTDNVQGFEQMVKSIHAMAHDLVDHNVTREELDSLRAIINDKILSDDDATFRQGFKAYDLRLRAEILPKLMTCYSISAYVLRRPDALKGKVSRRNVLRTNRLAHCLIEYFRYVRYGGNDLGEAFDSAWGQVLQLEARL